MTCARRLVTMRRLRGAWPAPVIVVLHDAVVVDREGLDLRVVGRLAPVGVLLRQHRRVAGDQPAPGPDEANADRGLAALAALEPAGAPSGSPRPRCGPTPGPVRNSTKIVTSPAAISPSKPIVLPSETPVTPSPALGGPRARLATLVDAIAVAAPLASRSDERETRGPSPVAAPAQRRGRCCAAAWRAWERAARGGRAGPATSTTAGSPSRAGRDRPDLGGGGATRSFTQRFLRPVLMRTCALLALLLGRGLGRLDGRGGERWRGGHRGQYDRGEAGAVHGGARAYIAPRAMCRKSAARD